MQQCPECGYAAADISSVHEAAADLIPTDAYQRLRFDSTFPDAARPFLCHALILQQVRQFADAGWTALHAAWIGDDAAGDTSADPATKARNLAIDYWKQGKRAGQSFGEEVEEFTLVTDVLRRAGRFEEALIAANEALDSEDLPELFDHILRFEKTLILKRDPAGYRLDQVPGLQ